MYICLSRFFIQLADTIQELALALQLLQNQFISLASVVLKKIRRVLYVLTAEKGDKYLYLIEEYCCYVNLSGQTEERTNPDTNCFRNSSLQGESPSLDSLYCLLGISGFLPLLSTLFSILIIIIPHYLFMFRSEFSK